MEEIQVEGGTYSFREPDVAYYVKDGVFKTFKNEVSNAVLKQFLGLDPNDGTEESRGVEGSVAWPALLDACVATAVQCVT